MNLNIKHPCATNNRQLYSLFFSSIRTDFDRTIIKIDVLLILRQNLLHFQLRPIRNLRIFAIGHGDFPCITLCIDYRLFDLRIRHPNGEHLTILHRDRQRFFTRERLHTDQSPVSGFHRLGIDLRDLLFCQFCAVFTLKPTIFLNLSDSCLSVNLADIY